MTYSEDFKWNDFQGDCSGRNGKCKSGGRHDVHYMSSESNEWVRVYECRKCGETFSEDTGKTVSW